MYFSKPRDCYSYVYCIDLSIFSKPWAGICEFGYWVCGGSVYYYFFLTGVLHTRFSMYN